MTRRGARSAPATREKVGTVQDPVEPPESIPEERRGVSVWKGMIQEAKTILGATDACVELQARIASADQREPIRIAGVAGSLRSLLVALLAETSGRQILFVAREEETVERLRDDLHLIVGETLVRVFAGLQSETREEPARANAADVEVLRALLEQRARIVLTHATALAKMIPAPAALERKVVSLATGSETNFTTLLKTLEEFGFERQQFVASVGEYSVRGGILDVFPFVGENPVRIEFFGDTVESIREFDATSQRSIKELAAASIVPNLLSAQLVSASHKATLLDFLQPDALIMLDEPEAMQHLVDEFTATTLPGSSLSWETLRELFGMFSSVHLSSLSSSDPMIDFRSIPQPAINGSVKILRNTLADLQHRDFTLCIVSDTQPEEERLRDLLSQLEPIAEDEERALHDMEHHLDVARIQFSLDSLHEGFLLPDAKLAVFTEHQIFNRLKRRGKPRRIKFKGITQRELHELRKGDYVVHADFGIGRYDGLKKIKVREVEQEVVKLLYEEKDTLYVNLNFLNKIQKYASKDGHVPKLTRLGSGEWDRLKARAKKRVKDIARDLILLYAKRKHSHGFPFQKDSLWQQELEASFLYEDTPDQAQATADVKRDMEAPFPMDRLVCGDVGFGKTEVAVRAAFKAVMSGKQVALLVPTTILAQQHYNTFLDRLSKYSTHIEVLSRFKTKREQAEILARLHSGSTDIIIGTHRLLSTDVRFKDLGLLIIDEEHRFGVAAKEKLRRMKENVDTLTLTATPIPRTLHFSLLGARDLSIIATPPLNRLPVITEIVQYDEEHIRQAILREVHRGGQVFFVHDRVHDMDEIVGRLQRLLPQVKFRQAHGQMRAHELEDVMLAFLERAFDVLVATKIIESGIDMPNVNTLIINRADRFGMAELYQLRGRVGRSNVQAYAYLLTPPISVLPRETLRRLQAIEEFTELGSGFNLAMRDLEIRGAGNLLGGEQSGFIESMGFEMYTKILEEAVAELKDQEFREVFEKEVRRRETENQTLVEADVEVRIPDSYIENDNERLAVYRRLFAVMSDEQLAEISAELRDRFGQHPEEVENLLSLVRVRLKASALGFRKVSITRDAVVMEFPPESEQQFYEAESFQLLMSYIAQRKNKRIVLRQNGTTLTLTHTFEQPADPFELTDSLLLELGRAMKTPEPAPQSALPTG